MTKTKSAFEAFYSTTFPQAVFGVNVVAMPCTCDDGGGPTHWAAVKNDEASIEAHESHERVLASLRKMSPRKGQT